MSIRSDTIQQAFIASPSVVSQHSTLDQQVMDQLAQMKTTRSCFRPRQEIIRKAFYNYLVSEIEALEDRDFQIFRTEAVKLISGIQSRTDERSHQPHQPSLSWNSSATSTQVPQTFQQPQQPEPAARKYILTIPETQMPASQVIQPTQQSQVAT